MSPLKQYITRRGQVNNKTLLKLEKDMELEIGSNKEYKIKAIIDSMVYGQQANNNQMSGFYYLVL